VELWKQGYNLTPVGSALEKLSITDVPCFSDEDEEVSERPARMLRKCTWVIYTHSNLEKNTGPLLY